MEDLIRDDTPEGTHENLESPGLMLANVSPMHTANEPIGKLDTMEVQFESVVNVTMGQVEIVVGTGILPDSQQSQIFELDEGRLSLSPAETEIVP